jgi:hypothetical protein
VYVSGRLFKPSLTFPSKAGAYPRVVLLSYLGRPLSLLANIRLGKKGLHGTNTSLLGPFLSYGEKSVVNTAIANIRFGKERETQTLQLTRLQQQKVFIILAPRVNVI